MLTILSNNFDNLSGICSETSLLASILVCSILDLPSLPHTMSLFLEGFSEWTGNTCVCIWTSVKHYSSAGMY